MTKMLVPCSQAAKAAAEGVAKAADEADAATHEVKHEKVKKTAQKHNLTKTAHSFSILLLTARCVACVRAGRVGRGYGGDGRRTDQSL